MSREILDCLKRERDICVKNVIHSQNTAFMFTPALRNHDKLKNLTCGDPPTSGEAKLAAATCREIKYILVHKRLCSAETVIYWNYSV